MPAALFQHFDINFQGRDFAVGDIHGCFTALEEGLKNLHFDIKRDRLFSVGDLVDRGPESSRFADYIGLPWFHTIRGNHEQMLIDAWLNPSWIGTRLLNGGAWSGYASPEQLTEWAELADDLPLAIEVSTAGGYVGIVHAGLNGLGWADLQKRLEHLEALNQRPLSFDRHPLLEKLLWMRQDAEQAYRCWCGEDDLPPEMIPDGLKAVVHGHTPHTLPLHAGKCWFIDTGAGYQQSGTSLTFLDLQRMTTYSHAISAE